MRKFNIDFNKTFKYVIILYAVIFLAGGIACAFGIDLDINFKGGTKISYAYEGEIKVADIEKTVAKELKADFTVTLSEGLTEESIKTFEISFPAGNNVSTETEPAITGALKEAFKDNVVELSSSNAVTPTIAKAFFIKSIAAVLLTAIFVVIYVGIRFRRIGGVSAALTALCALVFDVLVTFFVCVISGLQIDSNYIAVVLTILGYSLNDTIVIYDRVRENRKLNPSADIGELVNISVNQTMIRNIVTTVTTLGAVITILVIAEINGLTTLRTFVIPMAFGLVSGAVSSLFIAGPLWVIWKKSRFARKKAK